MGNDVSKQREELKNSVIKILYLADHQCKTVSILSHKDVLLIIFDTINVIPNGTKIPIKDILKLLTTIMNIATKNDNDQIKLRSTLKNILTEDKIDEIKNYFQSLEEYLKNHYPYVKNNESKIQQLQIEISSVRKYCTTLYNMMMEQNKIPMDRFWFYVTNVYIHLLLLKELILLEDLDKKSYNEYINDYCRKINELKSKFMNPNEIYIPMTIKNHRHIQLITNLESYDGKEYPLLNESAVGLYDDKYKYQVKEWAKEYYDQQMDNIDKIIQNLTTNQL